MTKFRVFDKVPEYGRKRIFGTENEYGITGKELKKDSWLPNGGLVYWDGHHPEYASPETSNPLEAVIFSKAGDIITQNFASGLYKNNLSYNGATFGSHENYFTSAPRMGLDNLLPFLVTRQIFTGSGKHFSNGRFSISQRSHLIEQVYADRSTEFRPIINTREQRLSNVDGWRRLHLILGDANMCEVAEFLKLGTTGLVIDLIEDRKAPEFYIYTPSFVGIIQNINGKTSKWGFEPGVSAVDVQRRFLDAAVSAYEGRDEITDEILARWDDVLIKLDQDPMQLVGVVDWVTKKALLDKYQQAHNLPRNDGLLANIDLQYHDINKETSLFYKLQNAGKIERITTDELIEKAVSKPPTDTRAHVRGNFVKDSDDNGIANWHLIADKRLTTSKFCCIGCNPVTVMKMPDPFNTYTAEVSDFYARIKDVSKVGERAPRISDVTMRPHRSRDPFF